MEKLKDLILQIFPPVLFLRALPLLAVICGLILFGVSYWIFPVATYPSWHDATKSLGQAIIVSGVVSSILNTYTYIGIFQKAVHNELYSIDFLKLRSDLPELWSRVTAAICQEKLAALAPLLQSNILAKYVPSGKNFYYSSMYREFIMDWKGDKKDGIVSITEILEIDLVPNSPHEKVEFLYSYSSDSRNPRDVVKLSIDYLTIDGKNEQFSLTEEEYIDDLGGKGLRVGYKIFLEGRALYKIRRGITRTVSLFHDPVFEFGSLQFILKNTVKVRSKHDDLKVTFVGVGTDAFVPLTSSGWDVHRELDGLMFPSQGYILFIQAG